MNTLPWAQSEIDFFARDGTLRDIYIPNIDVSTWNRIFTLILKLAPDASYSVDGDPLPLPATVEPIFDQRDQASTLLAFKVGDIPLHVYFFTEREFECDLLPGDVPGEKQFGDLCNFMRHLGDAVCQEVRLTPENRPDFPFVIYDPATRKISSPSRQ